ncbi:hypothetical protein F4678DRAFT_359383 [Xylaria arbuscula]|nr:hypothetical protein F4678DRAFT_359383 [Xylaria arbuscula]
MWHNLVSYASRLKTTMKRDRLPALSALASTAASKLEADIYLAGLWRNNLVRDLLWRRESQTLRNLDIRCPSWTWASYGGAITFQLLNTDSKSSSHSSTQRSDGEGWETSKSGKVSLLDTVETNFIPMAEVVNARTYYAGSNRFGEVAIGTIHLKTFYVPYASIDKLFGESLICKRIVVDVLERDADRFTTFDDTSFAILGRCSADLPMSETWHGLLLRDMRDRTYVRVGVSAVRLLEGLDDNYLLWQDLARLRQTRMIV